MTRRAVLVALALLFVVAAGGAAVAAFTDEETNPQTVTAATKFPGVGPDVKAQSANDNPTDTNQISLRLQVENAGDAPLDLGSVTMRYWFTNDLATTEPDSRCNYVPPPLDCSRVLRSIGLVEPARDGGDRYFEVGFNGGSLAPGAVTGAMQLQVFHQGGGGPFDQSDDYSHTTRNSLGDAPNVTVYVDGELVWGDEPAQRPVAQQLRVRYANLDPANPKNQQMSMSLTVDNTGSVGIGRGQITLRYWFTQDPGNATFQTACDSAVIGCGNVTEKVVAMGTTRPGADHYLEVGLSGGSLNAGSSTGETRLRVNQSDFANFDETDDYSWGTSGTPVEWQKVTAYVDGALVWGTEP